MPDEDEPIVPDLVEQPDGDAGGLGALLGGGGGGGLDFNALLEQATQMQQQMADIQERAAQTIVEGVAGGGVVKVSVTAAMDFQSITISPDVIDPDDVDMLQDLVLAALHDAVDQVQELQTGALGGVDLGGLGGLLGQ
ncbi:MAG: YbaB/EbfC family nucleoid-associated protein [Acidimicrobiia bacterium]|nr:YbaB/EbfC family nucleoid-associated protein [Acidimicrobiia bacterium]